MILKLNLGFALFIIVALVYGIFLKEKTVDLGEVIYLKLAPVDPRSLMQGDYMRLNYDITNEARDAELTSKANSGYLVLDMNAVNVGYFSHFDDGSEILVSQILFKYHKPSDGDNIEILPDSFLFQQGTAELYAEARYAIFKVFNDKQILVGLADNGLNEIRPPVAQKSSD